MTRDSPLVLVIDEYREWLKERAPLLAAQLRRGLKSEQITAALNEWEQKQEWAFPLPTDVFPLFEAFNGQKSMKAALLPNERTDLPELAFGSLNDMNQWRNNSAGMIHICNGLEWYKTFRIDDRVRNEFWNNHWFPFAMGEKLNNQESIQVTALLDFAPSSIGKTGQVVLHIERTEQFRVHLERQVVATSLTGYFKRVLEDLRIGRVIYDARKGLRLA